MKWFKHDAQSLRRAAIERLIMEYGIDGYGLYYACVEMIAGDIATNDLTFELKHDAELIAHKFKMDTIRVEKIMHRCIELDLFDLADSGRLRCLKLAQMLDESTSRHPEMIKLIENLHNSGIIRENIGSNSGQIQNNSDQKRIEEKRIEEKRREENINTESLFAFATFWNLYNKKTGYSKCKALWLKIKPPAYPVILAHVGEYVSATPDKKYRKNPETYLRNRCWNDEIIKPDTKDYMTADDTRSEADRFAEKIARKNAEKNNATSIL